MDSSLPSRPKFLPSDFGTTGHQAFVEIVVPPSVSYAPATVAWTVSVVLLCAAVLALIWRGVAHFRKNAYRREALRQLAQLRVQLTANQGAISEAPGLLKRCALAAYPRERVAALSGNAWLEFLERTAPGAIPAPSGKFLLALVVEPHVRKSPESEAALLGGMRRWMKEHHA